MTRSLKRGLKKNFKDTRFDAVLMIDCIASVPEPFFIYFNSGWDSLTALDAPARMSSLPPVALKDMRHRSVQDAIYERATGIFAESDRRARSLVEQSGVSRDKIHVVPPALAAGRGPQQRSPLRMRQAPRRKLFYVGRCYRTAGDPLFNALEVLRREYDPQITLTVVGMEEWPLQGSPPEGVSFLGILPVDEIGRLLDSHDLCVVPAAWEPYNLIFAEALSRGMPCVARDTGAMLEFIIPGVTGAVIDKGDPHALASAIVSVLTDDEIYQRCYERAPAMTAYFSWERVARQITQVISREIRVSS
jgi:glycosyltransferase involved in cell wall biosynthesis